VLNESNTQAGKISTAYESFSTPYRQLTDDLFCSHLWIVREDLHGCLNGQRSFNPKWEYHHSFARKFNESFRQKSAANLNLSRPQIHELLGQEEEFEASNIQVPALFSGEMRKHIGWRAKWSANALHHDQC
jgi:hypothetical protein